MIQDCYTAGDTDPSGGSIQILGNNFWQETVIHPTFKTLEIKYHKILQLLRVVVHINWRADREKQLKFY